MTTAPIADIFPQAFGKGVRVKPLVWVKSYRTGAVVQTDPPNYVIERRPLYDAYEPVGMMTPMPQQMCPSVDAAKSAAQAHWEAMVRSWVEPEPKTEYTLQTGRMGSKWTVGDGSLPDDAAAHANDRNWADTAGSGDGVIHNELRWEPTRNWQPPFETTRIDGPRIGA